MKPINSTTPGCDPISSECVLWQGPDISCISLCKGDTISTVVYKLAVELCTLMDMFKISDYDLTCLNPGCTPVNYQALIQLLIDRICTCCNEVTPEPVPVYGVNTIVPICPAFYYNNPQGDQVTSMPLQDYVIAIGNRVCTIINQIVTINATLLSQDNRITVLENAPAPIFTMPQVTPACVMPAVPTDIDDVLSALELAFCQLRAYTGLPQDILVGMNAMCPGLNNAPVLNGTGLMSGIPGWFLAPTNWAQSFSNLWKTVCDLRNAVTFIKNNCCDTGCDAIILLPIGELTDSTTLRLTYNGTIPGNYIDNPIGSTVVITDAGGGGPQILNGIMVKTLYYDLAAQQVITLVGINGALDVTVTLTARFMDPITQNTCEHIIQLLVLGTDTCPTLVITADYLGVYYAFTWGGTIPTTMVVELWNSTGTVMIQSHVLAVTTTTPSGGFINLTQNTEYKIRLVINGNPCDFEVFTTLLYPCIAPELEAPDTDLSDPEGDTTGITIEGWQVQYDFYHQQNN